MTKPRRTSATSKSNFDSRAQGCSPITIPLIRRPGATSNATKRMTRRSKGARCGFRLPLDNSLDLGLEPIFFHPPVQGTAAQAEHFRCLTHITLKALQRLANKNTFHGLQTQFLKVLCLRTLNSEAKISWLNLIGAAH